MKRALFKRRIHTCYLHKGLFALAVNLLLTSIRRRTRIAFESTPTLDCRFMIPGGQIHRRAEI